MGATRIFGLMVDVTRTTDENDTVYTVSGDEWRLKQIHKKCAELGLEPTAVDNGSFSLQATKVLEGRPTVEKSSAENRAFFQMLTSGLPNRPTR